MSASSSEYVSAFNNVLRTKAREEFKLMLCDLDKCEPRQIALLRALLFDKNGHTSATNWDKYIAYTSVMFLDRTAHLQRLVNKAFEFLEESDYKDDQYYLAMHLRSAALKTDNESCVKYFENVIMKKKIGLRHAALYIEWSKAIIRLEPTRGSGVFTKAKMVLEKGIELKAEPQTMIIKALKEFREADGEQSKLAAAARVVNDIVTVLAEGGLSSDANTKASSSSSSSSSSLSVFTFEQSAGGGLAASTTTTSKSSSGSKPYEGAEDVTLDIRRTSVTSASVSKRGPSTVEKKALGGIGSKKTRFGGLGMMGKVGRCQRVAKKDDEDSDLDSSRDMSFDNSRTEGPDEGGVEATSTTATLGRGAMSTMDMSAISMHNSSALDTVKESSNRNSLTNSSTGSKRKSTSSSEPTMDDLGEEATATATATATGTNKLDLSKYIDDKLLNFDPQGTRSARKRGKGSRSGEGSIGSGSSSALNSSALGISAAGTSMLSGSTTKESSVSRGGAEAAAVAAAAAAAAPQSASKRHGSETKRGATPARDKISTDASNKENDASIVNLKPTATASGMKKQKTERKDEGPRQGVRFTASSPSANASRPRDRQRDDDDLNLGSFNDAFKMVVVNQKRYLRFGTLGKGGSSCVYSVISEDSQVYAFKKVFVGANSADPEALFESYVNEIDLLNSLKGSPFIIQLEDSEVDESNMSVSMIMEAGEIDLSKVLKKRNQVNGISPFFIRMIWSEMLESVDHIHEHRIVHGDLKPANFVFVKGHLKLIDFGIAKSFSNDTTNIYRDSQIGTINYMAPEAIVAPRSDEVNASSKGSKLKLGRASDVWSLGCILYQLVYGSPPFAALNTIQKLHAIPNPSYDISYPTRMTTAPVASTAGTSTGGGGNSGGGGDEDNTTVWTIHEDTIDSIKACLFRDPVQRAPIRGQSGLLTRRFLTIRGDEDQHVI